LECVPFLFLCRLFVFRRQENIAILLLLIGLLKSKPLPIRSTFVRDTMSTAEEEIRRRLLDVSPEPDASLPFNGRVRLARRKKADPWFIKAAEVTTSCVNNVRYSHRCVVLGPSTLSSYWSTLCHLLSF
jgi:hypothetical protein